MNQACSLIIYFHMKNMSKRLDSYFFFSNIDNKVEHFKNNKSMTDYRK